MKTRDEFEGWLLFMDDAIDQARSEVFPPKLAKRLDFSLQSLSLLEAWLLKQADCPEEFLKNTDNFAIDRISRYVGETIRRNGKNVTWDVELKNKKHAFLGLPVLNGDDWQHCPAAMVTTCLDRRTGDFIEGLAKKLLSLP